ncbi:MAG: hypothetical protein ACRDOI_13775 [Trebonia sp.]
MTDGGAFQPDQEESDPPYRPRGAYAGHEVFGHGDGAVLVEPQVARDLRSAAESASQQRRIAGGLLYGRGWIDDEGLYLVVDGFLEAGPGEDRGDRISREGYDSFALSEPELQLLRRDAARMYSDALEVGWWRSLAGPGEFSDWDFETQSELVGPGGVGLLVFGAGLDWGTAYLGPDGQVPGSARSFIPVPRPAPEAPPARELGPVARTGGSGSGSGPEQDADLEPEPGAEPVAAASGSSLATRRLPVLTSAPQPAGPRVMSPVSVPTREWGIKPANPSYVGPKTPTDVKIVVLALVIAVIVAAIIVGLLSSSMLIAVIVGVVALLAVLGVITFSRL